MARLESSGLVVEEATAVPVSFYYRSAQYAEDRYTVLVVRETALVREIERLDTWLLEAAEYLKNHTSRFSGEVPDKTKVTKPRATSKTSQKRGTKNRTT